MNCLILVPEYYVKKFFLAWTAILFLNVKNKMTAILSRLVIVFVFLFSSLRLKKPDSIHLHLNKKNKSEQIKTIIAKRFVFVVVFCSAKK
jgi:hypothetical protein